MNDNERIAEWLDWKWDNRAIKSQKGILTATVDEGRMRLAWSPDRDITLWHGSDGLLAEINRRGLDWKYAANLMPLLDTCVKTSAPNCGWVWGAICAAPAQLAATLVKMIEEKAQKELIASFAHKHDIGGK